jgi:hypothetical protein
MANGYLQIMTLITLLPFATTLNVLILHPFGTGSHIKTLRHVSAELVAKGHRVTTVRMADETIFEPLGKNHTQFVLPFDNNKGQIPFVTEGNKAHYVSPQSSITYKCNLRRVQRSVQIYINTNVVT